MAIRFGVDFEHLRKDPSRSALDGYYSKGTPLGTRVPVIRTLNQAAVIDVRQKRTAGAPPSRRRIAASRSERLTPLDRYDVEFRSGR